MIRTATAALASLALAACATTTPYQPADASSSLKQGYSDQAIEDNRYRVAFKGNSSTPKEVVETYLLYRAAELTLQQGKDWFLVVDRDTEGQSRLRPDSFRSPYYSRFGFGYSYFHPAHGWRGAYDPFWREAPTYTEVTRYEASAEIIMNSGEKPQDEPRAFDAREVQKNLAARIERPES